MVSRRELAEHSDARERDVADLHAERRSFGHEHIDARAEANDAHAVALVHALTLARIGHDAPSDEPRDLPDEDAPRARLEPDRRLFVREARLLVGGVHE